MSFRCDSRLLAAALATVTGAEAATLHEADVPGGAFGASYNTPTAVAAGFDVIAGYGEQNRYDTLVFTGLPKGAQRLTFNFTAPAKYDYSYSAGGTILYDYEPFAHPWDGTSLGQVQVDYYRPTQSLSLDLAESFGGTLYLALNFTHGKDLAYNISVPSNASAPAPVPLPAGVLLMGSAVAALVAAGTRRRRGAAA